MDNVGEDGANETNLEDITGKMKKIVQENNKERAKRKKGKVKIKILLKIKQLSLCKLITENKIRSKERSSKHSLISSTKCKQRTTSNS